MQEQAWARSNDDEDAYWARYKPQAQEDSTSTESISIPCEICSIPFPIDCIVYLTQNMFDSRNRILKNKLA